MRQFVKTSLLLFSMMIASAVFTSCEWDTSQDPPHPLYVSYTITASTAEFVGPQLLLQDINAWIKENQLVYDKAVNYTTGEASEFAKTDAQAVSEYEIFLPKFRAYLDEVKTQLAAGKYGEITNPVSAIFAVYAKRTQGKEGNLKYDQIKFTYP